jgi:subtilisin family serine protease
MPKFYKITLLLIFSMLLTSCGNTTTEQPSPQPTPLLLPEAQIARHPAIADYSPYCRITEPPVYDPASTEQWQVDLRSCDLSKIDLSNSGEDLLHASFDSKTQWPAAEFMPANFDWQKMIEMNKDPGLGMRVLHEQGITGKGVGIAIVDQPLLVDHQEYLNQLRLYEEIHVMPDEQSSMHGAAVTSIAVGKTVGVGPDADLYYIGSWTGDWEPETNNFTWNFEYYAQAIHRVLEINQSLPDEHKIRVIAMQIGWNPEQKGYDKITEAVNTAKQEGVFVISSSVSETHGLNFHGLGRTPMADPNDFSSYQPGSWWQDDFYQNGSLSGTLLVPMDSRTTASPTGTEDYVFYSEGGWSWSIPYIAGMYVLASQVQPDITPDEFWETALETGRTIQIQHDGKDYEFGVILDPQALIEELKNK